MNRNISADAGELSALVVRCVVAPADSVRCVALEMRGGGGEEEEEGGGGEGGGKGGCGIPPRLRNDANLTPRKVTPRRIVFSIAWCVH